MQIALTCSHQKKKKNPQGFSNQLTLTMVPRAGWIYGLCSEWHNVWEPNRELWSKGSGPSRLPVAVELILGCYKADHHHDSPLLCNPWITLHYKDYSSNKKIKNKKCKKLEMYFFKVGVSSLCKTASTEKVFFVNLCEINSIKTCLVYIYTVKQVLVVSHS